MKCDMCYRSFKRREALKKHMEEHAKNPNHACEWCGKLLKDYINLKAHLQLHIGIKEFICGKLLIIDNSVKLKSLIPDLCGREVSSQELLTKHLLTHKTNNPFKCGVCGISYIHQSTLSRHSKIHGKIFDCRFCTLKFQYDSHLRRHLLEAHADINGISQPRPLPEPAPKRKKTVRKPKTEVTSDHNSSEPDPTSYYTPQQSTAIVNGFRPFNRYH